MEAHQEYQELLAPHALAALDAGESLTLESHLASCAECRAEFDEWRDATALLAYAATPSAPRHQLRASILSAIRQSTSTSDRVVPIASRRATNRWAGLLKIAAVVAFVALLLGLLVFVRRDLISRREIARLSREVNSRQRELTRDREALAREREMIALLGSANAKKMELAGTPAAQNARAMFVFDQQTGHAMLRTEGLPSTPSDKAYEVWFIPKGGAPMPGKVFTVDPAGYAMMSDEMPPAARGQVVIAITLEPKRGSAAPTGAIYLASPS